MFIGIGYQRFRGPYCLNFQRHDPDDLNLKHRRSENLKSRNCSKGGRVQPSK